MKIIETKEEFEKVLEEKKVLVDFFATWCGPCQMLAPLLEDLAKENSDLTIVKVDVDKASELAISHGVMSIPTLELYENKKLKNKAIGYLSKEDLEDFIK